MSDLLTELESLIKLVREHHYEMPVQTQLLLSQALDLAVSAERGVVLITTTENQNGD